MAELVRSALSDSQFIDIEPFGPEYRDSILQFQDFLTRNIHQMTGNFRQPFYGLRYYYDDGNLTGLRSVESEITVNGNCLFDSLNKYLLSNKFSILEETFCFTKLSTKNNKLLLSFNICSFCDI
jgi:hypothetical protein